MADTLGALIDNLYALSTERLEVEGKVEEMKSKERALREEIAKALTESGVNGATGQVANARKTSKTVATVKDWGLLWQYIKDHDAFDMVQRRCNDAAYRERLEAGEQVPGVEPFVVEDLSITRS